MESSSQFTISDQVNLQKVSTKPFSGQKPGTSGLRKKVKEVQQQHYLENFVQAVFNTIPKGDFKAGNILVIAGDGRYYNDQAIKIILRIACANGVDEVHVAQGGLMSTPAASHYIRKLNGGSSQNCMGGFLLTASHNPGGPENDFGIKYNAKNGGPAIESFTNEAYQHTTTISEYHIADDFTNHIDINKQGRYVLNNVARERKEFVVQIVDSTKDYVDLMEKLFDFARLKKLFSRKDFRFCFDALGGISGPYALAIFRDRLGADASLLVNCQPLPDFGGHHPDPNLVYAEDLVKKMDFKKERLSDDTVPDFGAACDGDADRNMVLGKRFFVSPSDSLAVLVANSESFLAQKPTGAARSMPTSGALDKVAEKLGLKLFETPTGWKFFGNLMDSGLIQVCGEESFGTGSDHIREKDGLWAVLAWLSVLAHKNENTPEGKLVSVEDILQDFWKQYGRNYYSRYDYEEVDLDAANKVMETLQTKFKEFEDLQQGNRADSFEYKDPVDGSVSKNQGLRFIYPDGTRVVFRLSGTGSVGATIRIYFEKYEKDASKVNQDLAEALKDIIDLGLKLSDVQGLTGRKEPTVIT
jgi:phosphoglucomutase